MGRFAAGVQLELVGRFNLLGLAEVGTHNPLAHRSNWSTLCPVVRVAWLGTGWQFVLFRFLVWNRSNGLILLHSRSDSALAKLDAS